MPDSRENVDPACVAVLDDPYLIHWENSLGEEMMPAFIADLIEEFEKSYAEKLPEARRLLQRGSEEELTKIVHFLKGSLGNMGLARASAFALQAELELRSGEFTRYDTFTESLDAYIKEGVHALSDRYAQTG